VCRCGAWHTHQPKKPTLYKKTNYAASISLTEKEYRKALNGEYEDAAIFWAPTGGVLTDLPGDILQEAAQRAQPRYVEGTSKIYWIVRF
jgi:hypothetical protein